MKQCNFKTYINLLWLVKMYLRRWGWCYPGSAKWGHKWRAEGSSQIRLHEASNPSLGCKALPTCPSEEESLLTDSKASPLHPQSLRWRQSFLRVWFPLCNNINTIQSACEKHGFFEKKMNTNKIKQWVQCQELMHSSIMHHGTKEPWETKPHYRDLWDILFDPHLFHFVFSCWRYVMKSKSCGSGSLQAAARWFCLTQILYFSQYLWSTILKWNLILWKKYSISQGLWQYKELQQRGWTAQSISQDCWTVRLMAFGLLASLAAEIFTMGLWVKHLLLDSSNAGASSTPAWCIPVCGMFVPSTLLA